MDDQTRKQTQERAIRWWKAMHLTKEELKKEKIAPAPTVWKAELKRCKSLDAVMLTKGFRALWLQLDESITTDSKYVSHNMVCWAMVAVTLAFVEKNCDDSSEKDNRDDSSVKPYREHSFARLAGKNGQGDKPIVSELRFAQLQQAQTPDEFVRRLRRILQQLNYTVSVPILIKDIGQWYQEHTSAKPRAADKRIAVIWAMDYYQVAN